MDKIKHLLSPPKKAVLFALGLAAVLVFLGAGTVFATATIVKSSSIGEQNAQNFAFADVGIDPLSAEEVHTRFGFEQGQFVYKVDFIAEHMAYAYWIKASDGTVVKKNVDMMPNQTVEKETDTKQAITLEEAKQIALSDAGLTASQVTFTETKRKLEDDDFVYEIEFYSGDTEYEYEIKEETGTVYSKSKETITEKEPQGQDATAQASTGQVKEGAGQQQEGSQKPGKEPASQPQEGDTQGSPQEGSQPSEGGQPSQPSGGQPSQPSEGGQPSQPQEGNSPGGSQEASQISLDTAKATALADAGLSASEVTYTKAELEHEDGILVYEIEFFTATHEYEYELDALTGTIRSRDKERLESGSDAPDHSQGGGTDIGVEKAKAVAVGHAGFQVSEVQFSKAKLEKEDGMMVYEIEFYIGGMEYEYEIHAATGEILKFDSEEDD